MSLGQNLRIARENAEISQHELARLCDITPAAISYFESDDRTPGVDTLVKLAVALKVTTDQLVGMAELKAQFMECPSCLGTGSIPRLRAEAS